MKTTRVTVLKVEFNKEGFSDNVNRLITLLHQEAKQEKFGIVLPNYDKEKITTGNVVEVYLKENSKLLFNQKLLLFLLKTPKSKLEEVIDLTKYKGKEGYVYYKANFLKKLTNSYVKKIIEHSQKYKPYAPKSFINSFIYSEYQKELKKGKDSFSISVFSKKLKEKASKEKIIFPFFKVDSKSLLKADVEIPVAIVEIGRKKAIFNGEIDFADFNCYGLSKNQTMLDLLS